MRNRDHLSWPRLLAVLLLGCVAAAGHASEAEKPVERDYSLVQAPPAPANQSAEDMAAKSEGCVSCHTESDAKTMHVSTAVRLGCTDCHGGNASIFNPLEGGIPHGNDDPGFSAAREKAHVLPKYPGAWHYPHAANPERTYTLLNREANELSFPSLTRRAQISILVMPRAEQLPEYAGKDSARGRIGSFDGCVDAQRERNRLVATIAASDLQNHRLTRAKHGGTSATRGAGAAADSSRAMLAPEVDDLWQVGRHGDSNPDDA